MKVDGVILFFELGLFLMVLPFALLLFNYLQRPCFVVAAARRSSVSPGRGVAEEQVSVQWPSLALG